MKTSILSFSAITNTTSRTELSAIPITMVVNPHDTLYDVDTLIDSLDYEKLYLNDELSPPPMEHEQNDQISSPSQVISHPTLGDCLQKAADLYKIQGSLPFNDDYLELIRQLFNNSSLTHLQQLHIKTLFLDR
jgi:hypothetical protein